DTAQPGPRNHRRAGHARGFRGRPRPAHHPGEGWAHRIRHHTPMNVLWNAFLIALREIRRNLTRAFLTVLGVIIGVGAVITMVTLGQATTLAVKNQISSLGSNLLMLRPGQGFGPRASSAGVPMFTEADAEAIGELVPGVASVAPVGTSSLSTIYRQNARSTSV